MVISRGHRARAPRLDLVLIPALKRRAILNRPPRGRIGSARIALGY